MNTTQLEFTAARAGQTQNEKLRDYFHAHPRAWLPMPELAKVITETGIGAAVHSRVADCRLKFGMNILQKAIGGRGKSCYWYEPPTQNN